MNANPLRASVILTITCFCIGCGPSYPPVSGKITYSGEPISGIRVVFSPVGGGNTSADTPFSVGVTDEAGVFSLETGDGESGAVAGLHKVGFDWEDIRSYTLSGLKSSLREARGDPEDAAMLKAKIAEVEQKLASRPRLKSKLQTQFEVPADGSDSVNFELTDL